MTNFPQRTDLAVESNQLSMETGGAQPQGIQLKEQDFHGCKCQIMEVTTDEAAGYLGKPQGSYYTLETDELLHRESDAFEKTVMALADILKALLNNISFQGSVLVAGLGNRDITPDAIGPMAAQSVLVTRHLKSQLPKDFAAFESVCVVSPGVMGTSGIESSDYLKAVAAHVKPSVVFVVDALCARSLNRLCRTIQITDTGISPGSGVGNSRAAISQAVLGVPVIAVGVPTVVEVKSILADYCEKCRDDSPAAVNQMIVTPRSIDNQVSTMSRVLGYAINIALHNGITLADIDMLL